VNAALKFQAYPISHNYRVFYQAKAQQNWVTPANSALARTAARSWNNISRACICRQVCRINVGFLPKLESS
jgi:hypothetical protein